MGIAEFIIMLTDQFRFVLIEANAQPTSQPAHHGGRFANTVVAVIGPDTNKGAALGGRVGRRPLHLESFDPFDFHCFLPAN